MKYRRVKMLITVLVMSSFIAMPVSAEPEEEIRNLETQKSDMESQAADVQQQLVDLLVSYDALQLDMENQEKRIHQSEEDLSDAQEQEKAQYAAMKKRIRYMYETGDASFLETLVTADSFTDLINKAEYIQNVHTYDRKQLDEYVKIKEEVQNLKFELEAGQAEMEQMAGDMKVQETELQNTLNDMESRIADFDDQLETAKAKAQEQLEQLTAQTESMGASAGTQQEAQKPSNTSSGNTEKTDSGSSKPSGSNSSGNSSSGSSSTGSQGSGNTNSDDKDSDISNSGSTSSGSTSKPSNSALGQQIANKACEYIGNPYEYGGNSLTNGIDCSGFVQAIHKKFGISTPRTSSALRSGGKAVSYSDMLPGDVICYSGHVAIYIGGNQIVHASNSAPYPQGGIKISSPPNYRTVLAVRRYW